jgi:hypothetical protein
MLTFPYSHLQDGRDSSKHKSRNTKMLQDIDGKQEGTQKVSVIPVLMLHDFVTLFVVSPRIRTAAGTRKIRGKAQPTASERDRNLRSIEGVEVLTTASEVTVAMGVSGHGPKAGWLKEGHGESPRLGSKDRQERASGPPRQRRRRRSPKRRRKNPKLRKVIVMTVGRAAMMMTRMTLTAAARQRPQGARCGRRCCARQGSGCGRRSSKRDWCVRRWSGRSGKNGSGEG